MAPPSLLLAASYPPTVGGIETLLYQTARRLHPPPLVLAPSLGTALAGDPPVRTVTTVTRGLLPRTAYQVGWRLHPSLHYLRHYLIPALRAVRQVHPAVIQVGHVYLAPLGWLLARRFHLPFVVYAFGQEVRRGGFRVGVPAFDSLLRGRALAASTAVLAPGAFTLGLLSEWPGVAARTLLVPYGADPAPNAVPPPAAPVLLSVGRLVPRKGIDTVLRALPAIARSVPDVTYRIVGTGPDRPRLEALADSLSLRSRVSFVGRVSDAELPREYAQCRLFVLPTRRTDDGEFEGYGLVHFEAAAHGRAVVAGRSGGEVDAVVDGRTGVLVDGESVEVVVRVITDLLQDDARLRALGEAGRHRVESTHNWEQAARFVNATLTRLTSGPGRDVFSS